MLRTARFDAVCPKFAHACVQIDRKAGCAPLGSRFRSAIRAPNIEKAHLHARYSTDAAKFTPIRPSRTQRTWPDTAPVEELQRNVSPICGMSGKITIAPEARC